MSDFKSLISPRSRAPIVFPADADEDEYEEQAVDVPATATPSSTSTSLALASHSTPAMPHLGMGSSSTTPASILKSRGGVGVGGGGDYTHMRGESPRGVGELMSRSTAVQNRLEEEASVYKRRLEAYRQAQHQQALLVARLQSKLLQYKQRCTDLESKLGQSPGPGQELFFGGGSPTGAEFTHGRGGGGAPTTDLEDALWKLEQERVRNENLMHLNTNLRGELEETRGLNEALSTDLQKLSDDWDKLTGQMGEREALWKQEEQAYSDYYANEHSKLLNLWRQVAATKRDFADLKGTTGRDLAQLKNAMARTANQISAGVMTTAVTTPSPQQEAQQASFIAQLSQEVESAQATHQSLRSQLRERDEKIAVLERNLASVEEKMVSVEGELTRVTSQDLSLLNNCLKEVAKLLLSDFDQHGLEEGGGGAGGQGGGGGGHDLHLSSSPAIFIFDDSGESPTIFAESVVSAVQAALNKRQLQVHQLQVNLASAREQGLVARAHVESLESDISRSQEKLGHLTEANEKLKDSLEKVSMERDTSGRGLDHLKNEKNILEQQRRSLATELDSTLKLKNNMAASLAKLEKTVEQNREDAGALSSELEKIRDELSSALSQLKLEQDLNTRIREQLTSVGDDKERNSFEIKSLKTQLNELVAKYEDLTFHYDQSQDVLKKWKMDAEILSEKVKASTERADSAEKEKKSWAEKARELDTLKAQLDTDLLDARSDLASLRREMLESERQRTDLEARIEKLIAQVDSAESRKGMLETQVDVQREEYLREMALMNERMEMLSEELGHTRKELEETQGLLDRTKGDLMHQEKLHMEAVTVLDSRDSALKDLSATLDKFREDKSALEELEHTLKSTILDKNKKIETLERQQSELKGSSAAQLTALRDKLTRAENEEKAVKDKAESEKAGLELKLVQTVAGLKGTHSATMEKVKGDFEEKMKGLRAELEGEKRAEGGKLTGEICGLRQQIESLRVQYEEALLRAENDKQQGLLLAQQDQQGLSDRIRLLERELHDLRNEKERVKRECESKCAHEKSTAAAVRSELIKLKNELETAKQDGLEAQAQIEARLADIEAERETALLQVEDLRSKLRSAEEREASVKRELSDLVRRLKDTEASGDHVRKELNDTRQSLTQLTVEREKGASVAEQLKEELSRRETDLGLLKKELNKGQLSLRNLERVKSELEAECGTLTLRVEAESRDKAGLARHLEEMADTCAATKGQAARLEADVAELKVKLEAETERRDEAEAQWRAAKKMLDESEVKLSLTKSEEERLGLRLAEIDDAHAHRQSQMMHLAEESKQREKKLMEEKHNLNVCLVALQQQIDQLTGKLNMAENRLRSLAEEKGELERQRKEANSKLALVQSGFKRLGFSTDAMENSDAARRVMATLQTQMAALQQDRDTGATQLAAVKDSLSAAEAAKASLEDQLSQISRNLQISRSDTKTKDSAIFSLEKDLALKHGELSRMADKIREMEDSVKARDEHVRSAKAEREGLKEDLERARARWDDARVHADSKLAKAEVQLRALDGDLSRMSIVLQQKEGHVLALEDKCAGMQRAQSELEERCASLTMTVEQLNIALEKGAQAEADWKDKFVGASRSSSENSGHVSALQEKLRAAQREKAQAEAERNNLSEKWEASSSGLVDLRRQVQVLSEKNQKLRQQTEEMTRVAIDRQLKAAFSETGGKDDLRQILADKLELQRKVDSLLDRIRELERENRELERFKDSAIPQKGGSGRSPYPQIRDNAVVVLEEENSDLRRKISKAEAEMRDLERRHAKHIGEVTVQVKQERDFELERARAGKLQAERLLEAREGNYRQQIARLEQQVAHLKEQLSEEIRRRQSFLSRSSRTGQEIRSLRQALGDSLRNVSMDPNTMENETRRLDTTLDHHKSLSQASLLSPSPLSRDRSPAAAAGMKK